jgi:hypothetical protein
MVLDAPSASEIGAQHVSAFPQPAPDRAIFVDLPVETNALGCVPHSDLVEVVHLGMRGLNPLQPPLHFVAVFQSTHLDSSALAFQSIFRAG